jgi:hypothetical protein
LGGHPLVRPITALASGSDLAYGSSNAFHQPPYVELPVDVVYSSP